MVARPDVSTGVDAQPIGYYVHHHGHGHAARHRAIAAACARPLVALSELELGAPAIRLPCDVPATVVDPTADGALHWAPIGSPAAAARSRIVLEWITDQRPSGMVTDVSVEATLLARLAGVPTVVVRQHGDRDDEAHRLAYRCAERLLAPFPAELEHPSTPDWVVARTEHVGFIAPAMRPARPRVEDRPTGNDIVVLWGSGGGSLERGTIEDLIAARPHSTVWLLGDFAAQPAHRRLRSLGFVDAPSHYLTERPLVVGSAGNNVVADAARAGCALVVAPQHRPFAEQVRHADSLDAVGAAARAPTVSRVAAWARAFDLAEQRRDVLARFGNCDGATAAASMIERSLHPAASPMKPALGVGMEHDASGYVRS